MRKRYERRTKDEWLEIIRQIYVSPLTQKEWAGRHEVSLDSISGWRTVLRREGLLDDLLAPVELDMVPGSAACAFLMEGRPDIRLVLEPASPGLGTRSLLLRAWSCGAECNDGNLYIFADGHANRIRIFRWKGEQYVDTAIDLPSSSLKWPRLEEGRAVLCRKDLIKLVRLILPCAAPL